MARMHRIASAAKIGFLFTCAVIISADCQRLIGPASSSARDSFHFQIHLFIEKSC